jgi:plasminogen activator inhibitor 1 RNA-binding protein
LFKSDHVKQADQSWGAPTGSSEWDDEKAGEEIAKSEVKEGFDTDVAAPVNADGEKPEGEAGEAEAVPQVDESANNKSYDDYLAEQAEKRLNLGNTLEARKPNEGSKVDKKWANAKALNKDDDEDSYIKGNAQKVARQRERKEKQTVEIDHRFQETPRGDRGRGRGRGGRGRGEHRGEHRGEYRGRGGRGGRGDNVNTSDESAFPKLGA